MEEQKPGWKQVLETQSLGIPTPALAVCKALSSLHLCLSSPKNRGSLVVYLVEWPQLTLTVGMKNCQRNGDSRIIPLIQW